ncbi:MAG: hypothetical protein IKL53_11235, partial [Lachnospiraceae bacterium]|nr:hypothetical protein [Lachnospiraceae bacterium]
MKKNVKVILAVVGLVVVGGIVALSVGKPNGIKVTDGPKYQYQVINPDDIIVEYSGLKPDKKLSDYDGNYVTDTSVYLSDTVGIYLGEEHFEAEVGEYVNYVDVSFKWNVSDKDLYLLSRRQLEASPSLFEGSITYADGFVGSIDADEVELKQEGDKLKVYITFRGDESVGYEIVIPEMWEDLNLNEESQEDVEAWYEGLGGDSSQVDESAMSGSVNEIKDNVWDGLYSVKDAPGLTNIDWNAFNGYMYAEQISFLGDDKLEINVLQVLGGDPRINNDWSALNEKFDALYGNDDEGLAKFANDLVRSYDYSVDFARGFCDYAYLDIEPYRTNTDSGVYGEIVELEITDKDAYDAWREENSQGNSNSASMSVYDQIRADFD